MSDMNNAAAARWESAPTLTSTLVVGDGGNGSPTVTWEDAPTGYSPPGATTVTVVESPSPPPNTPNPPNVVTTTVYGPETVTYATTVGGIAMTIISIVSGGNAGVVTVVQQDGTTVTEYYGTPTTLYTSPTPQTPNPPGSQGSPHSQPGSLGQPSGAGRVESRLGLSLSAAVLSFFVLWNAF